MAVRTYRPAYRDAAFNRGVRADGTSQAARLQAELDAAAPGTTVMLPAGTLDFTGGVTLTVPSYVEVIGQGYSTNLRVEAGRSVPLFQLTDAPNVTLARFRCTVAAGAATSGTAYGITALGVCDNLLVEDVSFDGFVSGVNVAGNGSGTAGNAQFTVRVNADATGVFSLGFVSPVTNAQPAWTADLAVTTTAAALQTALEGLTGIGAGQVTVTGGPATTGYTITFTGTLAGLYVPSLLGGRRTLAGTNAGVMVSTVNPGGGPWARDVRLRRVTATGSPISWGLGFDYVDGLTLDHVNSRLNCLDGAKLRTFVRRWKITDCDLSRNGQGWVGGDVTKPGDGLDCYPGGEEGLIENSTASDNAGSGFNFKNDTSAGLSGYASGKWGRCRKTRLKSVEASGNMSNGVAVTQNAGDSSYAVTDFEIDGRFERNGENGIFFEGVRGKIRGTARRNGLRGVHLTSRARFVDVDVDSIANGTVAGVSATGYGILCDAKNVSIRGTYMGVDTDDYRNNTDPTTGLTPYHNVNIGIGATAVDVLVDNPNAPEGTNANAKSVFITTGAANVITHQYGTLTPGSSLIYGSPGSTYLKTDTGVRWIKSTGAVDAVGTWLQEGGGVSLSGTNTWTAVNTFSAGALFGGNPGQLTGRQNGSFYGPSTITGSYSSFEVAVVANPVGGAHTGTVHCYYGQDGTQSGNAQNFANLSTFRSALAHRGTGTVTLAANYYVSAPVVSGGGTITEAHGVYVEAQKVTGVTTAYGVRQVGVNDINTFAGATTFTGTLTASGANLTGIPESAVTNLTSDLAGKAATVHTHTLSSITDAGTAASKTAGNAIGNVPMVESTGKLNSSILPPLSANAPWVVSSQAAMLALSTAVVGDVAKRSDLGTSFILGALPPSTLANWIAVTDPISSVTSVQGFTGVVSLTSSDIPEGTRLYYTTLRVQTDAPNVTLTAGADAFFNLTGQAFGVDNQSANTFFAGPTTGAAAAPTMRLLVAADIPTAVPATKIGGGAVSDTEFGYLDGVTSAIQTQLDGKASLSSANTFSGQQVVNVVPDVPVSLRGTVVSSGQILEVKNSVGVVVYQVSATGVVTGNSFNGAHSGDGLNLSNLDASQISTGTLDNNRLSLVESVIPVLPESKITNLVSDLAGKAAASHTHTASNITDFNTAVNAAPNLNASNLTSGTVPFARLPAPGILAAGTITTNYTPNVSGISTVTITLGAASVTINAPTNPTDGQKVTYRVKQDATGNRAVVFSTAANGFKFGSDITALALSTAAGAVDLVGTEWDAVQSKWLVNAFIKGF